MRDNARRLLTLLTVILALWLVLGFWPLSIGNQVIFSLCILLAGGAALWRQRRRAVSRQRSEIVLPPEDFQGAVVLVCGDTGAGDVHLFGDMLNRFFALYADMNQFNQLTLIVQPEGKCIRWKENHSLRLPG
ncbi:TPA: type VI secretion system baseplate subunit TssF [Klebsiella variicola subsp. variicola]